MISAERAAAQAEEYGHSVKREFCFLVAHSMLHLLGYDHMTPEEAADMEARQAKALEELNYPLNFFVHDPIAGEAFAVCRE